MSMSKTDLFTKDARKNMTKYKVYRANPDAIRRDPAIIRKIKSTSKIITDKEFDVVKTYKEMPQNLSEQEVVATAMDLYLTINLTENINNAR